MIQAQNHSERYHSCNELIFIFFYAQFETLIAGGEEWFLDLEAEIRKLIEEVKTINGELCAEIETLLKDEMEALSKEINETHTEEVTAMLESVWMTWEII